MNLGIKPLSIELVKPLNPFLKPSQNLLDEG